MAPDTFPLVLANWSESDLTDIDSDDEEIEAPSVLPPQPIQTPSVPRKAEPQPQVEPKSEGRSTRKTTQKATEESKGSKRIDEGPLPPYNQISPTIDSINKWMDAGLVELNPDYQRDVVWSEAKQMNLIDSVYHNYTVPNLVFRRWLVDGEYMRVCIDGKQRLTSIKRFIAGEIPYKDSVSGRKLWYKKTGPNQRRGLVTEEWKRKFLGKVLTIYDYEGITQNQERMIFQRVQLGTVLTPAERLQAINGPCANLVREIRAIVCDINVFSNISDWGGNRGKDFQVLAQIVFLTEKSSDAKNIPNALPEPEKLTPFLEKNILNAEAIHRKIQHAFQIFARLLTHKDHSLELLKGKQDISPVEFVMSIYAIALFMNRHTDCQLASALRYMWEQARAGTSTKKANRTTNIKSYTDMRSAVIRLHDNRVPLNWDQDSTKSADVPLEPKKSDDTAEDLEKTHPSPPPSKLNPKSKLKRSRSEAIASDDDTSSRLQAAPQKPQTAKRSKLTHKAKKPYYDSDDEMEDVAAAIIVPPAASRVPALASSSSGKALKSLSAVRTGREPSIATTKVKRPNMSGSASPCIPPPSMAPGRLIPNTPSGSHAMLPDVGLTTASLVATDGNPSASMSVKDRLMRLKNRRTPGGSSSTTPPTQGASSSKLPPSTFLKSPTPPANLQNDCQHQQNQAPAHQPQQPLPPAVNLPPKPPQATASTHRGGPSGQQQQRSQPATRQQAQQRQAPVPSSSSVTTNEQPLHAALGRGESTRSELRKMKFSKAGNGASSSTPDALQQYSKGRGQPPPSSGGCEEMVRHIAVNTKRMSISAAGAPPMAAVMAPSKAPFSLKGTPRSSGNFGGTIMQDMPAQQTMGGGPPPPRPAIIRGQPLSQQMSGVVKQEQWPQQSGGPGSEGFVSSPVAFGLARTPSGGPSTVPQDPRLRPGPRGLSGPQQRR